MPLVSCRAHDLFRRFHVGRGPVHARHVFLKLIADALAFEEVLFAYRCLLGEVRSARFEGFLGQFVEPDRKRPVAMSGGGAECVPLGTYGFDLMGLSFRFEG